MAKREKIPLADAAELYGLAGNATRLLLLKLLAEKEMHVGELAKEIGVSLSAISQHLAKLKAYGLINRPRRDAQTLYYSVSDAAFVAHALSIVE